METSGIAVIAVFAILVALVGCTVAHSRQLRRTRWESRIEIPMAPEAP
jgi:hypothetical protein